MPRIEALGTVNFVDGFLLDKMHQIPYGIGKKVMDLWFNSTQQAYSISKEKVGRT